MNQLGTERTEDRQGGRGFTVMGRRKRFRLVMRLEAKARGSIILGEEEIRARNEEKKVRHKEESKRRGKMMAMATRLARRPWKKHEQEEAEETMSVAYQGDAVEIGFNVSYLQDILGVLDSEMVRITVLDANSSALLEEPENDDAIYVVMPMKL